jgi:hypothetical protein
MTLDARIRDIFKEETVIRNSLITEIAAIGAIAAAVPIRKCLVPPSL